LESILALDQGTTSSKAVLYDRGGAIRGLAQRELGQIYPRAGLVGHDPEEIWASQMSAAVEALSRADSGPRDTAALGITDQPETTILWERKTVKPVCNAMVWQDRRTEPIFGHLHVDGQGLL
jgi:glycerol kinase